jgi:glycosidase
MATYEFHVSRKARQQYQFDEELFSTDGRAVVANFEAARRFAAKLSAGRPAPVPASDINALGLLDEVMHILIRHYERQNPGVMTRALSALKAEIGDGAVDATLYRFSDEFPALAVFKNQVTAADYLNGKTESGVPHRETILEEMILLNVTNLNPAVQPYKELFDDQPLRQASAYEKIVGGLDGFFKGEPGFGGKGSGETLLDVLKAPAAASPYSLAGQLEFVIQKWGAILGEDFVLRLLRGMDFVKEEIIRHTGPGGFRGSEPLPDYSGDNEYERFSPDREWMPRLVLIAKNAYVWLDQLSRQYGRDISRLDQVPDEELSLLARRGFSGLWLIGLWERSTASKEIKQRMGQSDAVASAYSLYDYDIAQELGGWDALNNLRWRAWQVGMRLAADMVPNHMGIDSKWVIEHPDWFLSLPHSPYPNYEFNSGDLSRDSRVGIILEDHYYNHSDAAVVFKRVDRWSGEVRYIYHGNDGTSMPWNDTAQLDFLKAEVREAVIQTILHVARNFPVIRFDAAMTLAKKHVQRLWFPEPGAGGAIPSRSEYGLTRRDFEAAMPQEFWREVVDRVAAEVPDTLLLAEAFWMMEGYFVRTLGMHRVYNSAFMHMLRDEDNSKYRQLVKNTLEYDPRILQRYVNFMNNPDEKTAVEQFGKADKYFGVCVVMATMPGLPMYGHGQIEGFAEKYGMEYRRAKWQETADEGFITYHEQVIFPLNHRRHLFAGVENYWMYDFFTSAGYVNEDVLAYSNNHNGPHTGTSERSLVIYHNKYAQASGWVKTSVASLVDGKLVQKSLVEGLSLPSGDLDFVIFRDNMTGLEYMRSCKQLAETGLYVELGAYKCHVFLDWQIVHGPQWAQIHAELNGAGVQSVQEKFQAAFGEKPEVEEEDAEKAKKPAAKPARKKRAASAKKVSGQEETEPLKPVRKKRTVKKE